MFGHSLKEGAKVKKNKKNNKENGTASPTGYGTALEPSTGTGRETRVSCSPCVRMVLTEALFLLGIAGAAGVMLGGAGEGTTTTAAADTAAAALLLTVQPATVATAAAAAVSSSLGRLTANSAMLKTNCRQPSLM